MLNNNTCEIDFFIDFELNIGVFNILISRFFNKLSIKWLVHLKRELIKFMGLNNFNKLTNT